MPAPSLRIVSFESRRSRQMADLIRERGGEAIVAPSMREVPLEQNEEALRFGEKLLSRGIDAAAFMTPSGANTLFDLLSARFTSHAVVEAFRSVIVVGRGPKTYEALECRGVKTIEAPSPATWREVLSALLAQGPLAGKTVAVQEDPRSDDDLANALAAAGAKVVRVPVYRWALPEDRAPLRDALQAVIAGRADIVLFTNSNQIHHVLKFAQEEGVEQAFRDALARTVVASVGPVTTEYLDEYGVPVDLEPEQPRMEALVEQASAEGPALLQRKKKQTPAPTIDVVSPQATPTSSPAAALHDSAFMKACRREPTPYTPIWLMRQAGRYMKEYREVRERHSFLDLCKDSDLATEVTVYAANRLGVDAAIIFSDILLILEPMGLQLEYAKGDGPVIHNPVREPADIERLRPMTEAAHLQFVYDAIGKTRAALPANVPLIGFCGAPFTLASYMIEGAGSRNYIRTKSLMYKHPDEWDRLMKKITAGLMVYLRAQVAAGAQAVQLFDSWVGCLSPQDYRRYVLPYSRDVIQSVPKGTPVIHFGTQTGTFIELIKEAGGDVIGLDWRVDLGATWPRLGDVAIMGNMDPVGLFAEIPAIQAEAKRILAQAGGRPGHIFNLGHGILPNTPVGHVKALVEAVHDQSRR